MSGRFFSRQLSELSRRHRVIALDLRAHGRSEEVHVGHTLPAYARDLHAAIAGLGLSDVVLVGWSMGAFVVWDYLDQFTGEGVAGTGDRRRVGDGLQVAGLGLRVRAPRRARHDHGGRAGGPSGSSSRRCSSRSRARRTSPGCSRRSRGSRRRWPRPSCSTRRCATTGPRFRLLTSQRSSASAATRSFSLSLPARTSHGGSAGHAWSSFEDSGHCPFLEEPERFNAEVERFIESLPRRAEANSGVTSPGQDSPLLAHS
jgi:non-heme chloroperoxidase